MFSAQHKFGRLGAPAGRSIEAAIRSLLPDVWYDPSDLTTLFQDSAGTTPVTALEQPVGLMRDKSGNNRHAYHTPGDTTTRPVVSRRINLLTKTEDFADAAWGGNSTVCTTTKNNGYDPKGNLTFTRFDKTGVGDAAYRQGPAISTGTAYKFVGTLFVTKDADETRFPEVSLFMSGGADEGTFYQLNTKTGATTVRIKLGSATTSILTEDFGGFWKVTINHQSARTDLTKAELIFRPAAGTTFGVFSSSATGVAYAGWASLVPTDLAALPYQRVNTTTDYDSDPSKFPTFLRCDGVNDSLQTNAIDFSGTDKMFAGAAVRKLSDAAAAIVAEFSANVNSNNGSFSLSSGDAAGRLWSSASKGTIIDAIGDSTVAPNTAALSMAASISAPSLSLRKNGAIGLNGVTPATSTATQGTGNYGNHKLYLFMRAGTSLPFNGWMFGALIKGATLSASQIALVERWLASKTKTVTLA